MPVGGKNQCLTLFRSGNWHNTRQDIIEAVTTLVQQTSYVTQVQLTRHPENGFKPIGV